MKSWMWVQTTLLGTHEALDIGSDLGIGFQIVSQGTHEALDVGSDYVAWNT